MDPEDGRHHPEKDSLDATTTALSYWQHANANHTIGAHY